MLLRFLSRKSSRTDCHENHITTFPFAKPFLYTSIAAGFLAATLYSDNVANWIGLRCLHTESSESVSEWPKKAPSILRRGREQKRESSQLNREDYSGVQNVDAASDQYKSGQQPPPPQTRIVEGS